MSTVRVVQSGIVTTDAVREIGECFSKIIDGVGVELDGEQTSSFRSSVIE